MRKMEKIHLTQFAKHGGCAAKIGPDTLGKVLGRLPKFHEDNLLVGFETSDDAAVYKLSDDTAVIQTLDFFTPVVDDPYTFGQIAAANALSDVYAMGGEPKIALNIVCFPGELDPDYLGEILQARKRFLNRELSLLEDIRYKMTFRNTDCRLWDLFIRIASIKTSDVKKEMF